MALKGKKKARRRGSQARRKPAAPPRPVYGGRDRKRWYQTTSGLVMAALLAMTVVIVAIWWIADSRSDAKRLETTQNELQDYTARIRAVSDSLEPVASGLVKAGDAKDEALARKVDRWKTDLSEVQASLGQAAPPPGAETANSLLLQTVLLYVQAVEQYELVPRLDGNMHDQVAGKAAGSFQAANSIFTSAIEILDEARADAELEASGLTAPGASPTSTTTIEDAGGTP